MSEREKVLYFILVVILILLSPGCGNTSQYDGKISVLTTTSILGDIVAHVGGDLVSVTTIIPIGSDPHEFTPRPKEATSISTADIIFIIGAGLEDKLLPLFESADGSGKIFEVSRGVDFLFTREEGPSKEIQDPHVWMNPGNILIWIKNIADALVELDPLHEAAYQENAVIYSKQIETLDEWVHSQVEVIPDDRRVIVSDHDVLGYFNAAYGFHQLGTITGSFSTDASPSAQEIANLEELIIQNDARAIFISENSSLTLANQIAFDTGIEVVQIYHASLTKEEGPASTYLDFIRYNVTAIVDALR